MNVEDVIAERIAAAVRKAEAQRADRARRQAARSRGLAARHAQKLRHLAASGVLTTVDNSTPAPSGAA